MTRRYLDLLIPVVFAIGCLALSSSVHAQKSGAAAQQGGARAEGGDNFGPHFNFISAIKGGAECLTVRNGELVMIFPCNTLRESSVEVMDGLGTGDQDHTLSSVLRIKLSLEVPQVFLALTVTLPAKIPLREPIKVMANPTGIPFTPWRITAPDANGLRSVVAVFEKENLRFCMMPRPRPGGGSDVVVNNCGEGPRWKLEPVPAPI